MLCILNPNVLLEALACSLPVISTDCKTGPRELLAPLSDYNFLMEEGVEIAEFGILVPIKRKELLSKAMDMIYADKTLYSQYKNKCLPRARSFDISLIAEEYKKILV